MSLIGERDIAGTVRRLARKAAIGLAVRTGWARQRFAASRGRVRILNYHGLIPDHLRDRPWVCSHHVTVSQFERHMAALARVGPCPPLSEAMARVRADNAQPPAICVTFDDGTADNVHLALPTLRRYGHHATFFLTTGWIGSDWPTLNDVIRLLRPVYAGGVITEAITPLCRRFLAEPRLYKRCSLRGCEAEIFELWTRYADRVDREAGPSLRMMNCAEMDALLLAGMDIGAHTAHHVILATEDEPTRREEIAASVECIRSYTGCRNVPFSYPNGQPGDYGLSDMAVLEELGVSLAVTESPGWNTARTPLLALRRQSIGLHTSFTSFLWQVFGASGPEQEAVGIRRADDPGVVPLVDEAPACL